MRPSSLGLFRLAMHSGVDLGIAHHVPGGTHAHLFPDGGLAADINILDLRAHISAQTGRLHAEILEHEGGFPVGHTGPARLIGGAAQLVFQPGIGDGGTDGVCIRVLVADDIDLAAGVCHSVVPFPCFPYPCGAPPDGAAASLYWVCYDYKHVKIFFAILDNKRVHGRIIKNVCAWGGCSCPMLDL